jgi:hypothetical protein
MVNTDYFSQITNNYMNATLQNVWDFLLVEPDKVLLHSMVDDGNRNVYMACAVTETSSKTTADMQGDEWQLISSFVSEFFIRTRIPNCQIYLAVDKFLEFPTFPLYMGSAGMGFTRVDPDPADGVIRRIDIFRVYENYLMPQLTLPVLFDELGVDKANIEIHPATFFRPNGSIVLPLTNGEVITIPIDRDGKMIVNWTKPWNDAPFGAHIAFHALLQYREVKAAVQAQADWAATHELTDEERQISKIIGTFSGGPDGIPFRARGEDYHRRGFGRVLDRYRPRFHRHQKPEGHHSRERAEHRSSRG